MEGIIVGVDESPGAPAALCWAVEHGGRVGRPVTALASLVVVGSRGHGQLAGTILGSVSDQVTHHAASPVVLVP
jgi:nucleotide-binding universal stress UspA family protein